MASYALLNAYSGFEFDMSKGMIGFAPVENRPHPFRCFWSLDPAWGTVSVGSGWVELQVMTGALALNSLRLPEINPDLQVQANLAGEVLEIEVGQGEIQFSAEVTIQTGQSLILRWEA
jgi:hypothetical protein